MVEMDLTVNGGIKSRTMDDRWLTEWLWKAVLMFGIVDFNECIVLIDYEDELTILP